MLDVITDFWKPVNKKVQPEEKTLTVDDLQVGCTIGFGFVPQALVSGRRLEVASINTYQFGDEKMTSYVFYPEKESMISMIVAQSDSERYLALSRRISFSDRMKLFETRNFDEVIEKAEGKSLSCKDGGDSFKGWLVPNYTKQIHGLKGKLFKADLRSQNATDAEKQELDYFLLVSESNEHAIEIEKYADGRIELYATVYRRMSDIGQVMAQSDDAEKTAPKLFVGQQPVMEEIRKEAAVKAEPAKVEPTKSEPAKVDPVVEPAKQVVAETSAPQIETPRVEAASKVEPSVVQAADLAKPTTKLELKEMKPEENSETPITQTPIAQTSIAMEKKPMNQPQTVEPFAPKLETINGSSAKPELKPSMSETMNARTDVKAAAIQPRNALNENENVECELRIANKIIEEAIRGEMRLSDVVRRIVELPVAYQEAVQLPITLTDEDYLLLSIRYGIPAADKQAIKRRIVEDLNDFAGGKKKAA